ncbi:hypothetical protein DF3PA_50087 [Candidatus Defluviicoccus seviourii]|uniref:Uncharacterized protein n=2 Tax=root TaxID=1 RepID=A0A564WG32_9PROT|nr:hypothetical protein DF3PB_740009 [uncultured Defluviicoccus sp.]VUX47440.1 hypothetical protein DF3PA_50087 [Candidatus Defluviicoccus seviourii]
MRLREAQLGGGEATARGMEETLTRFTMVDAEQPGRHISMRCGQRAAGLFGTDARRRNGGHRCDGQSNPPGRCAGDQGGHPPAAQ